MAAMLTAHRHCVRHLHTCNAGCMATVCPGVCRRSVSRPPAVVFADLVAGRDQLLRGSPGTVGETPIHPQLRGSFLMHYL
jgi:hypothetical protein